MGCSTTALSFRDGDDDNEYVFVASPIEDIEDDDVLGASCVDCRPLHHTRTARVDDVDAQVRDLQAAQMRWEIQRMDMEMQLMTERSERHQLEDQLHRATLCLARERTRHAGMLADLRAQLLFWHKRMAFLKELREKFLTLRPAPSSGDCDLLECGLLEWLKREVPKIDVGLDDLVYM
ncbi:Aste57867_15534 [Aphanomyces stellatus]|uniref:Aste57867_15534 protein n=1 Tax=Aphanomyces stellatus TaxID=120398 RepID=A0A485L4C6_9STRA|nr:hypothetical protein As57867_015478 [Aphanomyces stellatus]VFT92336.1 Aste57867_15534 [Aphanomyces stellatus]